MPDVENLRQTLLFEEISRHLAKGETARATGRNLNIKSDALKEIMASDEFLVVLRGYDADLADGIVEERDAAKPLEYEQLLMDEAKKSVEVLVELRDGAEDDKIVIAACAALVGTAEKVKKVHVEKTTTRVTFPSKQLETLLIAGKEVDALEQYAESEAGGLSDYPGDIPPTV